MYTFQHRPRPQISCVLDLRESWNTVSKASRRRFSFIVPAFEDMEAAGPAMIPRGVIHFSVHLVAHGRGYAYCAESFFLVYTVPSSVSKKQPRNSIYRLGFIQIYWLWLFAVTNCGAGFLVSDRYLVE